MGRAQFIKSYALFLLRNLQEYPSDVAACEWALVQCTKGMTLHVLSERQEDATRGKTLQEAVACYDSASSEWLHEVDPKMWAIIQYTKGSVLDDLAKLQEG